MIRRETNVMCPYIKIDLRNVFSFKKTQYLITKYIYKKILKMYTNVCTYFFRTGCCQYKMLSVLKIYNICNVNNKLIVGVHSRFIE